MSKETWTSVQLQSEFFYIFHWNLNNVRAHNIIKSSRLCANIATNQCKTLYLSETFLNSTILSDNVNMGIPEYSLVREDYIANTKYGGVDIYFQKALPLRL